MKHVPEISVFPGSTSTFLQEGHVLLVEQRDGRWNFAALGYEVPEKLPTAPPDVVKEVERAQET